MEVRAADFNDAKTLSALATAVWIDTYTTNGLNAGLASFVLEKFSYEALYQIIETDIVFVAEESEHILGYAVLEREQHQKAELKTLYVLPKSQGRGIGKKLLTACEEIAAHGLWLTCWEHNHNAHGFYLKNGLIETGEDTIFIDGRYHRNIVFGKIQQGKT